MATRDRSARSPTASARRARPRVLLDGLQLRVARRDTGVLVDGVQPPRHAQRAPPARRALLVDLLVARYNAAAPVRRRRRRRPSNVTSIFDARQHARRAASRRRSRAASARPRAGSSELRRAHPPAAPRCSEALERMWPVLVGRRARPRPVRLPRARALGGRRRARPTTSRRCCTGRASRDVRDVAVDRGRRRARRRGRRAARAGRGRPGRAAAGVRRRRRGARRRVARHRRARRSAATPTARRRSPAATAEHGANGADESDEPRTFGHVLVDEAQDLTADAVADARPPVPVGLDDARRRPRPGEPAGRAAGLGRRARAPARRTTRARFVDAHDQLPHAGRGHGGRRPRCSRSRRRRVEPSAVGAQHRRASRASSPSPPATWSPSPRTRHARARPRRAGTVAVIAPRRAARRPSSPRSPTSARSPTRADALDAPIAVLDADRRQGPRVRPRRRRRAGRSSCTADSRRAAPALRHAHPHDQDAARRARRGAARGPRARRAIRGPAHRRLARVTTTATTSPPPTSPGISSRSCDGRGDAGVDALLDAADGRAPTRSPCAAGTVAELDAAGARRGHARGRRARRAHRPRRQLRRACASRPTPTDPGARRAACSGSRSAAPRSAPSCCSSSSSGPSCPTSGSTRCSPTTGSTFAAHHLRSARRYRPHLLTEPEEVDAHREGGHRAAARGRACSTSRCRRSPSSSTARPSTLEAGLVAAARRPTATVRAGRGRGGHRGARARACARARSCFNTLLADKAIDDRLRHFDAWIASRNLANEASDESVQALVDAVQGRYDDPAALVHAEGAAARPRPHRRLRPHGVGRRRRERSSAGPRRKELVLDAYASFSPRARRHRAAVLRRAVDRRAGAPGQAAGRVLRVHGAVAPPVPAAELDVAPARRADARARARPRAARVPRARAGRVPPEDAADAGRDRVGVRRDGHVRSAARRRHRPARAARAARARASRIRSRRCSARSR